MTGVDDPRERWRKDVFFRLMLLEDEDLADCDIDLDFSVESLGVLERQMGGFRHVDSQISIAPDESFVQGLATYLGETLMRLAGGAWAWDAENNDPLVCADPALGLAPISPVGVVVDAMWDGDGQRFTALYREWERAVAALTRVRPGWRPVKEHTNADDPPTDSAHLNEWLPHWEAAFSGWAARYGPEVDWDFSPESLPALEEVLRRTVSSGEALHDPANREFRDGAAWYLGEVMRRGLGGHWMFDDSLGVDMTYEYLDGVGPTGSMTTPAVFLEAALTNPGELREHYEDFSS